MDLTSSYFDIFGLPEIYLVDLKRLAERYRALQREYHPDRFAGKSAASQRQAVQATALINQAYAALRSPVERAQYLLARRGMESGHENTTVADPEFLMMQMELRETLAEVTDIEALEAFAEKTEHYYQQLQQLFDSQYRNKDLDAALTTVAKMQFYRKLQDEIEELESSLD